MKNMNFTVAENINIQSENDPLHRVLSIYYLEDESSADEQLGYSWASYTVSLGWCHWQNITT
jgi:hypothetical protein